MAANISPEAMKMLKISDLSVSVEGKEILHDINMNINTGETHVLFGPNGAGKSTLLMAIMGFPKYKITKGSIFFKDKDITYMNVDERARMGIGMSFQRPPVVRGVKTRDMMAACLKDRGDGDTIVKLAERADMQDFLERDINYGFSGGEVKRSELMQLLAQKPELTLLDEPESGVDLVNIALIGEMMNDLLEKNCPISERQCMGLIITHTGHILDYVNARTGYVMCDGTIGCVGDPHEMLATIREKGYNECIKCYLGRIPFHD
jgi:Fe-S cluster assembly ATP-binding protein